ncbi:Hypothetical predicted protein, partial [Mytilus galloprovincialis]
IREKRKIIVLESREKRTIEKPRLPRTAKKLDTKRMTSEMGELGVDVDIDDDETHLGRARSRSVTKKALKRKREQSMEVDTKSRSRSRSRTVPRDQSGVRDPVMAKKVKKIAMNAQKARNHQARKGEGDRVILDMKPKHLFAGKRKQGKTDRR